MAWSYTANPGGKPADLVRLLLGDTDATSPLCDDAEVAFALLDQGDNAYLAAAWLADRIAAKLARDESFSASGVSISPARSAERFREMAVALRREAGAKMAASQTESAGALMCGAAVVTGARLSDMAAAASNADRVQPSFDRVDQAREAWEGWQ